MLRIFYRCFAGPAVVPPCASSARRTLPAPLPAGAQGTRHHVTRKAYRQSLLTAYCLLLTAASNASALERLRVVIHVHSSLSTGSLTPEEVIAQAEEAKLDAVVFTDSLSRRWEYGLWPARKLIRKVVEQPSVIRLGTAEYLRRIDKSSKPGVLAIAGVEAAPFYYWRRSPFDKLGGEVRNWNQHLLVFGIDDPKALENLPLNNDPYHGDKGTLPYQRFIDVVAASGGFSFWAHPEVGHTGAHGGIDDHTEAYPSLVEATTNHQGFAITYLGYLQMVAAGGLWDRMLMAYCEGRRKTPSWVIGESDWRSPQERPLTMAVTEAWVEARTAEAVLAALREGHMWASIQSNASPTQLLVFSLSDGASTRMAISGDHISLAGKPVIRVQGIRPGAAGTDSVKLVLVKNGAVFQSEEATGSGFEREWVDDKPGSTGYYRLIVEEPNGIIVTNPIFVRSSLPAAATEGDG